MSFAQMNADISPARRATLLKTLAQEWGQQRPGLVEPIIIEEPVQFYSDLLRLYVIWDEWSGMGQRERSKIIMEAYQLAHPERRGNTPAITVAMGLTPAEAKNMGIEYTPLDSAA